MVVLPVPGFPSSKNSRPRVRPPMEISSRPGTPKFALSVALLTSRSNKQQAGLTQVKAVTIHAPRAKKSVQNFALRSAASELVGQRFALRCKIKTHGVDAIAFAGRWRAVWEDMALMAAAPSADDLRTHHAIAGVANIFEVIGRKWLSEARPPGATFELRAAVEQRQAAEPAGEHAGPLFVEEHAAERCLGAMLEQHLALFIVQIGDESFELVLRRWGQVESRG